MKYALHFMSFKVVSSKHPALINSTLYSKHSSDDEIIFTLVVLSLTGEENSCENLWYLSMAVYFQTMSEVLGNTMSRHKFLIPQLFYKTAVQIQFGYIKVSVSYPKQSGFCCSFSTITQNLTMWCAPKQCYSAAVRNSP